MVECEECGEWFHLKCMGRTKAPTEDELWFCNKCVVLYLYILLHRHIFTLAYIQLVS